MSKLAEVRARLAVLPKGSEEWVCGNLMCGLTAEQREDWEALLADAKEIPGLNQRDIAAMRAVDARLRELEAEVERLRRVALERAALLVRTSARCDHQADLEAILGCTWKDLRGRRQSIYDEAEVDVRAALAGQSGARG